MKTPSKKPIKSAKPKPTKKMTREDVNQIATRVVREVTGKV